MTTNDQATTTLNAIIANLEDATGATYGTDREGNRYLTLGDTRLVIAADMGDAADNADWGLTWTLYTANSEGGWDYWTTDGCDIDADTITRVTDELTARLTA